MAVFALAQLDPVKGLLAAPTQRIPWPGLATIDARSDPTGSSTFTFDWLSAGGTMLLIAGLATVAVLRVAPRNALAAYADTVQGMRWTIVTITAVLALASVMTASGQTLALGSFLATTGAAFAFLSPIIGWLGVTVTGSDTASNALFGALQIEAASDAHLSPTLMAAANSSGGVLGKMCSVQHLAIAAAAVGMSGKEGDVFRRLLRWSIGLTLLMGALVWLQSTPILGLDGDLGRNLSAPPALERPGELPSRADVELGEHLAQMPLDGSRTEEQLRPDFGVGPAIAGEPRDLDLLRGEFLYGDQTPLANLLARCHELAPRALRECLHPHRRVRPVGRSQLVPRVHLTVLPSQPFAIQELGAGEGYADPCSSKPLDRLEIKALGLATLGQERSRAGIHSQRPVGPARRADLMESLERRQGLGRPVRSEQQPR